MRQVFGAFGTAMVVTILHQRQAFHSAILSQLVTPENTPLQPVVWSARAWALGHGMPVVQAQAMGFVLVAKQVAKQVAIGGAVMAYDDVFRVTAAVTFLALIRALFLNTRKTSGRGGESAMMVD